MFDGKRSMNVNIVLKLFKLGIEEIGAALDKLDTAVLTDERLQSFVKILPIPDDEVAMLKGYDGDMKMLADAERFILRVLAVRDFEVFIVVHEFTTVLPLSSFLAVL